MLKLRLEAGEDLDKYLDALAKSMSKLLERGMDVGLVRVLSYPSLDSIIASSAVYSALTAMGVEVSMGVSVRPPERISVPTILVGFTTLNYRTGDVEEPLIAVTSGSIASTPPPGAVYVESSGSVAASLGLVLGQMAPVASRPDILMAMLAASYASRFVDKMGRFYGVDKVFLDKLVEDTKLSLETATTLKVYKPQTYGLCESLSVTVSPYFSGFTGDREYCERVLAAAGLEDFAGRVAAKLHEDELEKVSVHILSHVKNNTGRDVDVSDYLGGLVFSSNPSLPITDPRMAADVLMFVAETTKSFSSVTASILDPEGEYRVAEASLEWYSRRFSEEVARAKLRRVKSPGWVKVFEAGISDRDSVTLIARALRLVGRLEENSILAFEHEGRLATTTILVEEMLGQGYAKRLVDSKLAEEEGILLWLKLRESA